MDFPSISDRSAIDIGSTASLVLLQARVAYKAISKNAIRAPRHALSDYILNPSTSDLNTMFVGYGVIRITVDLAVVSICSKDQTRP